MLAFLLSRCSSGDVFSEHQEDGEERPEGSRGSQLQPSSETPVAVRTVLELGERVW